MIAMMMHCLGQKFAQNSIVQVPKVLVDENIDLVKILAINLNHVNFDKMKDIAVWTKRANIVFLMEVYKNTLPEIEGFDKYVYPSKYYNTLYVKSIIEHKVDLNGYGFQLDIANKTFQFMYIPPYRHKLAQFPNGIIIGDINWVSNKFEEPLYHEKTTRNYQGMSVINTDVEPTFLDYDKSDHKIIEINFEISTKLNTIIDNNRVMPELRKAMNTGTYKKPMKIKHKTNSMTYYSFNYWLFKKRRPTSKIYNNSMFGPKALDLWINLYKHNNAKTEFATKSEIKQIELNKIKSKARDTFGVNYNDVIILFRKYKNETLRKNLLTAIKDNNVINTLMLKKRELNIENFNVKDFRLICILPTYLKLKESTIEFKKIFEQLPVNLVGFSPGMDVHTLIALLIDKVK